MVKFIAPQETIDHYETCCFFVNSTNNQEIRSCYEVIPQTECSPVEPGTQQRCTLYKETLAQRHVLEAAGNISASEIRGQTIFLSCFVRAVNNGGIAGPESVGRLEILVDGNINIEFIN